MDSKPDAASADVLLRTAQVASLLAVSKSALVRWRQSGEGPAVCWLADGIPRYRVADVQSWLEGRATPRHRAPRRGSGHADSSR
ncbi:MULTISPECIES: helix-turn-helix transcriptional regulator [unclassified Leucobacter]|uniref:helix-turn-helix transcriptional regulator n=1 Tax=unclassified Leucobacter TaxID=2621730 RepID=UPI000A07CEDA|nr:helix-turn-helix domain-containing protein [Leucobacter sp. Ag1]